MDRGKALTSANLDKLFIRDIYPVEPQAVAVSLCGWLMTHYGWLAGLSRLAVVSTAAA